MFPIPVLRSIGYVDSQVEVHTVHLALRQQHSVGDATRTLVLVHVEVGAIVQSLLSLFHDGLEAGDVWDSHRGFT